MCTIRCMRKSVSLAIRYTNDRPAFIPPNQPIQKCEWYWRLASSRNKLVVLEYFEPGRDVENVSYIRNWSMCVSLLQTLRLRVKRSVPMPCMYERDRRVSELIAIRVRSLYGWHIQYTHVRSVWHISMYLCGHMKGTITPDNDNRWDGYVNVESTVSAIIWFIRTKFAYMLRCGTLHML